MNKGNLFLRSRNQEKSRGEVFFKIVSRVLSGGCSPGLSSQTCPTPLTGRSGQQGHGIAPRFLLNNVVTARVKLHTNRCEITWPIIGISHRIGRFAFISG